MRRERIDWHPHGWELFTILNFVIVYAITVKNTQGVITTLPVMLLNVGVSLLIQAVAGIIVRVIIAAIRGELRQYLAVVRSAAWIVETVRILFFSSLVVHIYGWIKTTLPLLHPRLFDQELWDLDRAICFGISPNIFVLNLFSNHYVLRVVDMTYGNIFIFSLSIAFGYFVSSPSRRLRLSFMTGHAVLWISGAWLYLALPSLGPAYRFPEIWFPFGKELSDMQSLQALLWKNYREVLKLRSGGNPGAINLLYGIAAFPSMHVAFQTFVFLWFRRLWTWGEVLFAIFVLFIFLGALITGFHYLIDLFAGIALAVIVWIPTERRYRISRWAALRRALS